MGAGDRKHSCTELRSTIEWDFARIACYPNSTDQSIASVSFGNRGMWLRRFWSIFRMLPPNFKEIYEIDD
jgi:hypothetical protein